jgi:hypothetical protein
MTCLIGHIPPVEKLLLELGLPSECTSWRPSCRKGLEKRARGDILGAYGAALGYCQALLPHVKTPAEHTRVLTQLLDAAGAPCSRSHELFWGHVSNRPVADFIAQATSPLRGSGRVPVFITPLDVQRDGTIIDNLFETPLPESCDAPILVRLILTGAEAVADAAALMKKLLARARDGHALPQWWPLFQANMNAATATKLRMRAADEWPYYCFAVNPFTSVDVMTLLGRQIVVAQLPVGAAEAIGRDRVVRLPDQMQISGARPPNMQYSVPAYADQIAKLGVRATVIVLGPAVAGWTDRDTHDRLARLVELLPATLSSMWSLPEARVAEVLQYAS